MFWDDILLVTEQAEKYGPRTPFVALQDEESPVIADYALTTKTGDQHARFVRLNQRPFDHLDPGYQILTGDRVATKLEELPLRFPQGIGFCAGINILEHHPDPAHAMSVLYRSLLSDSLLVIASLFNYPYQSHSEDYWRFTPDGLSHLAKAAGFAVLECGFRLSITVSDGIKELVNGNPQEVKSVYLTASKGTFQARGGRKYPLPKRISENASANALIASETAPVPQAAAGAAVESFVAAKTDRYSCVFLNTYYNGFLRTVYERHPHLQTASYREQLDMLQRHCFGDSDFYSKALQKEGWDATDLIINAGPLQEQWKKEKSCTESNLGVAVEQLRRLKPDVVYCQDMHMLGADFSMPYARHTKLIIGQIASPFGAIPLDRYDAVITSFPHFAERFNAKRIRSFYVPLAFEPRVLSNVPTYAFPTRAVQVSFVGGISPDHTKRLELLDGLCRETPIEFWGYGRETLLSDAPIRTRHHGEVWGLDMFTVLAESKITLNSHIDAAENNANNMRLFEATGCGALLITDYKDNLNQLFEIGDEIVAYRSADECIALVKYYLSNPAEAEVIAQAGQSRTLRDHTYEKRLQHVSSLLIDLLRSKG